MITPALKKKNEKDKLTKHNSFIIPSLIFILPLLTVSYIFFKNKLVLNFNQILILFFTSALIICGLLITRQVFSTLIKIATFINKAEGENKSITADPKNIQDLQELTTSFNNIMKKFDQTTEELKLRVFELFTIKEIIELASKSLDIDSLLNLLLEKAMTISKSQAGCVFIMESEGKGFRVVGSIESETGTEKNPYGDFDNELLTHVATHKTPLLAKNIEDDPRVLKKSDSPYKGISVLYVPILVRKKLIGILSLSNKGVGQAFDSNDEQFLIIMIGEIAFALENAMLHSTVSKHSEILQKRTEQLTLANKQLKKEIAERKKLWDEKNRLEAQLMRSQKMEAIGTFAGEVAHDLNNVLSGVISYPDLLLMQLPKDSPFRKSVLSIQESGKKAAAIVHNLLTLERKGHTTHEIVNLNIIISEYFESPEYKKLKSFHPGVEIITDLDTKLFNIKGSAVHLFQTVMNLVSNGVEAMPEGGKLTISTDNRCIDRSVSDCNNLKEGDYIVLKVSDTGMGISLEDMERIFEPFYTKKVMGRSGTGLGMAIVRGTVNDHNGHIDVKSVKEKGTTLTLYLPASKQKITMERNVPSSLENFEGKGESILVVDDVREQRIIASSILHELGYSVTAASSGHEAIEYLQTNSVDLLLLDMIMNPGIDGLDTYKQVIKKHPGQKAIITSGYSETERVKKAQELGVGQYINKPYTFEKIGNAVRTELDK